MVFQKIAFKVRAIILRTIKVNSRRIFAIAAVSKRCTTILWVYERKYSLEDFLQNWPVYEKIAFKVRVIVLGTVEKKLKVEKFLQLQP